MRTIEEKFQKLGVENAPGQEVRQKTDKVALRGEPIPGRPVDFSHGDVDAHPPIPGSAELFMSGVARGGDQAYTEYRGTRSIREDVARKLSAFTGTAIDAEHEIIITPGTQGALFMAMGACMRAGDKVAILEPDYFANRKLVAFLEGEVVPIPMDYLNCREGSGIDLARLEQAFKDGVRLFLFSNPNNPTGVIYTAEELTAIAELANRYGVSVIADELYARQVFDNRPYTHLCALKNRPEQMVTIIGPSKTESLSGYRLGAAFGSWQIIDRMEKLQAIVSLRAPGYCQRVLKTWFDEPAGWMEARILAHRRIRDDLMARLTAAEGVSVRLTEAGSYLFVKMPPLDVSIGEFARALRLLAGVVVTPGTEFGPQFTDCFRINFSQDHAAAVDAIERTLQIMERYKK
jgi:aspartate/methionine/tyrosine aminotransferase